jgi:hypothetical protein
VVYLIAGQFESVVSNGGYFLSKNNSDLHSLLVRSFSVLEDWPNRFYEFLNWRKSQNGKSDSATGLITDFGSFYSALYKKLKSPHFDFMRGKFEEYLHRYWDGGSLANCRGYVDTTVFREKYLTKTQASIQLKCYADRIDRLIKAGRIKGIMRKQKCYRLFLVNADSVEQFKRDLDNSLSLTEASRLLGVSGKIALTLVQNECLNLLCGHSVDGSHAWKFTPKAIHSLLDKIRDSVVQARARRLNKISFSAAVKRMGYIGCKSNHLVRAILDGTIIPCDMGQNISSLLFVTEDISNYVEEQLRAQRGDGVLIREATLRLGFKTTAAIYFLIKKGVILCNRKQDNRGFCRLITQEQIEEFRSTYMLPTAMAVTLGTSSANISKLLMMNGITPISGPGVDGGRQFVFRKADIEAIDPAEMVLAARRTSRIKSHKKLSLISSKQAAETLGITVKVLYKIVRNGVLSTYRSNLTHGESKDCFSLFAVNRLRNLNIDYTRLISISAAARMFGQLHIRFSKEWVQPGCLQVKHRIDKQYLLIDDVQDFVRLREKTVTTGEAAKILGVGVRAVTCHLKAGRLRLAAGSTKTREGKLFWRKDVEKLSYSV